MKYSSLDGITNNVSINFFYCFSKQSVIKAKRPPVEETASFLQALITSHGPDFLEKLFGAKARNALAPLGGVERVAIALSGLITIQSKQACNLITDIFKK